MPIEFEAPKSILQTQFMLKTVADEMMRPRSRYFDEHEHEIPWDYIEFMHLAMKASGGSSLAPRENGNGKVDSEKDKRPSIGYQLIAAQIESLAYGDLGMYHCLPGGALGAAAVHAAGTPEQKEKFLARFREDKPTFAAMCITEAGAGSDNSAIRTRAVLDEKTNEWVINGEKIFVTGGDKSFSEYEKLGKGFIVVWATIDPTAGRAGMRAFVVEGGTPGVKIVRLENKLGIRVSDTAAISMVDVCLWAFIKPSLLSIRVTAVAVEDPGHHVIAKAWRPGGPVKPASPERGRSEAKRLDRAEGRPTIPRRDGRATCHARSPSAIRAATIR